MRILLVILVSILVMGCGVKQPEGISPVTGFKLEKYMGRWYEVARLDHPFERGLNSVSATYRLDSNGKVLVKHEGYMVRRSEWRISEGKAFLAGEPNVGFLKVSYVAAFYDPYVIFGLGEDYEYAFVAGKDKTKLWLLAREPYVDWDVQDEFIEKAKALGFDTSELIFVQHI